jgi:hypothetical protein
MRPVLYVRFRPDWISIRRAGKSQHWEGQAVVSLEERAARVVAIAGEEIARPASTVTTIQPFDDGRSVVGNIHVAEILLRHAIKKLAQANGDYPAPIWSRKPDLILHPIHLSEDGLSSFEIVGLQALGASSGAHRTYVWLGRSLTDQELRSGGAWRHCI